MSVASRMERNQNSRLVIKETLVLTKCILIPPNPNAPPPTTRDKPLGCKTIFVGGLPEKATEEVIREIFERCGEIIAFRMSRRNFCHIRFANQAFMENAMYFSGYVIKVEKKDESGYIGRLHVDYAQARDDQYEYECQQRALEREERCLLTIEYNTGRSLLWGATTPFYVRPRNEWHPRLKMNRCVVYSGEIKNAHIEEV